MHFIREESGATAIEYGLLLALIAVMVFASFSFFFFFAVVCSMVFG